VQYNNIKFQVWDLGGQTSIRYVLFRSSLKRTFYSWILTYSPYIAQNVLSGFGSNFSLQRLKFYACNGITGRSASSVTSKLAQATMLGLCFCEKASVMTECAYAGPTGGVISPIRKQLSMW
jgi:GTPase SAR1 family protein